MKSFAFIHVFKNAGTSIGASLSAPLAKMSISFRVINSVKEAPDSISFAVSRNPYTRCLSSWQHCHSTRYRPLLDCLNNPPQRGEKKKPNDDYRHFTKKQSEFIFDDGAAPTHILRFESLEEDIQKMFSLYNVPAPPLLKLNTGDYNYTLNGEEREAIYEFYKEDFERLGYDK